MTDVVGIGNPLLDFIVEVDDSILKNLGLEKARMTLISAEKSKDIMKKLEGKKIETAPGGSSANVIAGVACLGGTSLYMGSVGGDENGKTYEKLSQKFGAKTSLVKNSEPTGHAITFITPDFERTFGTFLGSALLLRKKDIDEEAIKKTKILHIEGFQFENPEQTEASVYAMKLAKEHNVLVSIDLADSMFIESHLKTLQDIVLNYANIVFVNEREAFAFTGEEDPTVALKKLHDYCDIAVVTVGPQGSLIMADNKTFQIPPLGIEEVNTNGAGDMYDAAFLWAYLQGYDFDKIGKIASYAAAQVVASYTARLTRSLKEEIKDI